MTFQPTCSKYTPVSLANAIRTLASILPRSAERCIVSQANWRFELVELSITEAAEKRSRAILVFSSSTTDDGVASLKSSDVNVESLSAAICSGGSTFDFDDALVTISATLPSHSKTGTCKVTIRVTESQSQTTLLKPLIVRQLSFQSLIHYNKLS